MNQTVRTLRTVPVSRSKLGAMLVGLSVAVSGLCVVAAVPTAANAVALTTVDLGSAASFSVLAGAAATVPGSGLAGEVGSATAITTNALTWFGSIVHTVNDAATVTALHDATTAYAALRALPATGTLSSDDLAGQVIVPGVYHRVAAYAMTTPVTFDAKGDPNAFFIMQNDAALNTTAGTTMNLINGAQANHIFWVTVGAATLGASSTFSGTMISGAAITVGATSTVCGRALSVIAAVTLDADTFCVLPPVKTVQAAVVVTSVSGTYGSPMPLTSSGGSGTGTVTYAVVDGSASDCAVGGVSPNFTLISASAGTCLVTATKAGDVNYLAKSSVVTTVTLTAAVAAEPTSAPTISGTPKGGTVGSPYNFAFVGTGSPAPTFATTGTLPSGLTLSSAGVLSGTPLTAGTFTFLVTATNGVQPNANALASVTIDAVASLAPSGAAATPVAVTPSRALDTRLTKLPLSGSTTNLKIAGLYGVPADAQAVFLNVTAVDSTDAGYVTVWAAGTPQPGTSNLNVERSKQIIPNMVVTPLGANGDVNIFVQSSTQLVVDVMGYIPAGVGYSAITPQRALDTRTANRPANSATTTVKVTDVAGAPTGATSVILNLTAVKSSGPGYLTVWPTGQAQPSTSNLNVDHVGQTRPNMVIVPIGADGKISIFQQTSADVIVDVVGFFTPEAKYNAIQPSQRLLDTRAPTIGYSGGKPGSNTSVTVKVAGVGSVPADAKYVIVNLTADQATNDGYVTVYPGNTTPPVASNLNLDGAGATASNLAFVPIGDNGNIKLYTQSGTHLVLDVFGWVR